MPTKGYASYIIAGAQSDWDTIIDTADFNDIIYEFMSSGLRNISTPLTPTRFKGNASPMPQIENFLSAEGDIQMNLHADNMVLWLTQALMDDTVSKTSPSYVEVFGDGAGNGKAWVDPDALDTQPNALSPSQAPAKLRFTFSGVVTQSVVITGTDQNDTAITETLTFAAEAGPLVTTYYFKTVTSIDFTSTPPGGETLLIEASKNVYVHTIELKDDLLAGMTIEEVKGALPSTYIGCLVNQMTLDLGDIITLTLSIMAKRGWNSYIVQAAGNTVASSETPTDVSGYTRVSQEVFPAWGMALEIDGAGTPTPIGSMSLVVNNQLVNPSTRYRNSRTLPKPVRSDNREITLTCNIDYDSDNNEWDEKFETMQEASAILYCYRKPFAGAEYKITFTLPRCQIGAYPDPAVTDYPEVLQEIILRPIRTAGATGSDEMTIDVQCLASS